MAYITQDDLLTRITPQELLQLTDDARSGQVNATTVSNVIEEATGLVDGYCRSRYQVPLQPSNEVTRICRDVAVYFLFSRRPQKMPDTVRQRYEDTMSLLKQISTGTVQLDQPDNSTTPQTTVDGGQLPSCNNDRFTDCNLKGFI